MSGIDEINLAEVHFADQPTGGYTYKIPDGMTGFEAGIRVRVPFSSRRRIGIITRIFTGSDSSQLRDVLEPVDHFPLIPQDILELTRWIADYYMCDWGEAITAAIPAGLKPTGKAKYKLSENGGGEPFIRDEIGPAADLWRGLKKAPLTRGQIQRRFSQGLNLLDRFIRRGWIELVEVEPKRSTPTMIVQWRWTGLMDYEQAIEDLPTNAHKLKKAVRILAEAGGSITQKELGKIQHGLAPMMRNLVKKGWVSQLQVPVTELSQAQAGLEETATGKPVLTPQQAEIVSQVRKSVKSGQYQSFLLHGITGSGKTLVYLDIIAEALALGKGVIVMVPEISLTPQLTGRIRRRFGDDVVVTHSGLSAVERRNVWRMVQQDEVKIVVGPRSVVFAPVQDLGLIVIDEEHDDSYKQSEPAPRYHGRNVALYRAFSSGATVLMGSATPDICSYKNALDGRYRLVELKERYGGGDLPGIWVVTWGSGAKSNCLSPKLEKKLQERLERGEQAILLVNRRGFSTIIRCPDCGEVATCPNCDITLRYHRVGQKLVCHYCGYEQRAVDTCPKCHGHRLNYGGLGTQRLQRELELHFPDARVERMDIDTTHDRGAHQEILSRFARHDFDILIGTQMVAKGHDFPRVTLVGILSADPEWLRPDFRTVEKAYRLLTQASGRTGRAGAGEVVIQAWDPSFPMLRWVQEHNYRKLYDAEIATRKELRYPPFSDLISVLVRGTERDKVNKAAFSLKDKLSAKTSACKILGPAPPSIERIENLYRRILLLKLPRRKLTVAKGVKKILQDAIQEIERSYKDVKIIVNVDPIEI